MRDWHRPCLSPLQATARRKRRRRREADMGARKKDLEKRRATSTRALQSSMRSTREEGDRAEMSKDPYGSASSSHDDELAAINVDRLARDPTLIHPAPPGPQARSAAARSA